MYLRFDDIQLKSARQDIQYCSFGDNPLLHLLAWVNFWFWLEFAMFLPCVQLSNDMYLVFGGTENLLLKPLVVFANI